MTIREEWRDEHGVTWSDGTFDSVERFVDNQSEENIRAFVESGSLDDLFDGSQAPDPLPYAHVDYMQEYAERKVLS